MNTRLNQIQAKFDRIAIEQLRAEVARLAEENEQLRRALDVSESHRYAAEAWAETWRDDFYRACETNGTQPGLTTDGHLVPVLSSEPRTSEINTNQGGHA